MLLVDSSCGDLLLKMWHAMDDTNKQCFKWRCVDLLQCLPAGWSAKRACRIICTKTERATETDRQRQTDRESHFIFKIKPKCPFSLKSLTHLGSHLPVPLCSAGRLPPHELSQATQCPITDLLQILCVYRLDKCLFPRRRGLLGRMMVIFCMLFSGCRDRFLMRTPYRTLNKRRFGMRMLRMLLALSPPEFFLCGFMPLCLKLTTGFYH